MIVLSISGKAGAGKDTAANLLIDKMMHDGIRVCRISFAGKLKDACSAMFGWDRERLDSDPFYKEGGLGGWVPKDNPGAISISRLMVHQEIQANSQSWSDWVELDTDPYCMSLGKTRRVIMQQFGTECMRDGMDKNFWVKLIEADIEKGVYEDVDVGVISDARFLNELEFTQRQNGFSMLIERADSNSTLTQHAAHASEQEWQQFNNFHIIVINDISKGQGVLADLVVSAVYTRIIQTGLIGKFPDFNVQQNVIQGSIYVKSLPVKPSIPPRGVVILDSFDLDSSRNVQPIISSPRTWDIEEVKPVEVKALDLSEIRRRITESESKVSLHTFEPDLIDQVVETLTKRLNSIKEELYL